MDPELRHELRHHPEETAVVVEAVLHQVVEPIGGMR
jgi:hypothetical protein